ncbi:hypothetical protein B0T25DRAFT_27390 [Lasiosphaeria hispida]|uniref:Uncharacterized protein n=1 Tax=Lasiosphaeria hispida TaxID=260671 RepID=A0AAJ0HUN7_9PEZI|nr:hypothetical protein B0T25DRAFT_27390 [Lasiosphaeria hispida]
MVIYPDQPYVAWEAFEKCTPSEPTVRTKSYTFIHPYRKPNPSRSGTRDPDSPVPPAPTSTEPLEHIAQSALPTVAMGRWKFTKLQSHPEADDGPVVHKRSRRAFTRLELCLLVPLVVFAAALGAFTIVYIIQHQGAVRPAAVAALCCTSLTLLSIGYVVSRRARRPDWCRDLESGSPKNWHISAPVPLSSPETRQPTFVSKASYTSLPYSRPSSPCPSTLTNKVYLAVKNTFKSSPNLLSRSSFESSTSSATQDDRERLIENQPSAESPEIGAEGMLWTAVFELSGEARLAELKRLSIKELSAGDIEKPNSKGTSEVKIVVTKPQPIASPPRSRRGSSDDARPNKRGVPLEFDPLRSNPFQVRRDLSVRLTKSAQTLSSSPSKGRTADPILRRPRSAEPGPDRPGPRPGLAALRPFVDRVATDVGTSPRTLAAPPTPPMAMPPTPPASPGLRSMKETPRAFNQTPRALRRLPTPAEVGAGGRNLRAVYQNTT